MVMISLDLFGGFGLLRGALTFGGSLFSGGSGVTGRFGVSVRQGALLAGLAQHLAGQLVVPEALRQLLAQVLSLRARSRDRFCSSISQQR